MAGFHECLGHLPGNGGPPSACTPRLDPTSTSDFGALQITMFFLTGVQLGRTLQRWRSMARWAEKRTVPCLVDGHWLMARTNWPRDALGRLKQWLHRRQIEEDVTTVEGMEAPAHPDTLRARCC